jgi:ribosomal protein S18 acetylase RimI-like enzyme
MADLLAELFAIEDDFTVDPIKQIRALSMLLESEDSLLLVAERGGEVIGMVSLQPLISTATGGRSGLIEDLVVAGAHRGSGVGTRLIESLVESARAKGFERLSLGADRRNASALAFYAKYGFSASHMGLMYRVL